MRRDLDEILVSQATMIERRGAAKTTDEKRLRAELGTHLERVGEHLRNQPAFEVCDVAYRDVIDTPDEAIARIIGFLGRPLDARAMRVCVEPGLYRVRSGS